MNINNINWEEQYARFEMDEAFDKYLDECEVLGIVPLPYSEWKKYHK